MANRTARLRREQEAYAKECTIQAAFHKSKQQQQLRRSARRLQPELEGRLHLQDEAQSQLLNNLLRRKSTRSTFGGNHGFFLAVLHCLGSGKHWRELNSWRAPRSRRPQRVFDSLARHVLVRFPLPKVLQQEVIRTATTDAELNYPVINWFLHVAGGDNLSRAAGLPFEFTKKAAHFLAEAPEELLLLQAMRWAQVRAMGGTVEAADAFASELREAYGEFETEWTAVIRFVIQHWTPEYELQIPRIVQFIRAQRLEPLVIRMSDMEETVEALYPNFDIRQATEQSLMSRVFSWENHVQTMQRAMGEKPFPKIGMREHQEIMTSWGLVSIHRLLNIKALVQEGTTMRHCVGSYGRYCQNASISIWSLSMEHGRQRLATLELGRNKRVREFRGKANSRPGMAAQEALKIWAKRERLLS